MIHGVRNHLPIHHLIHMRMQKRKQIQPVILADGIHALNNHFAQSFACPHNIGRVDCLVSADKHKTLRTVHQCCISCLVGADHIVLDCLIRAALHQRHMFMGGCMVYNVRAVFLKYHIDPAAVAHGTNQYNKVQAVFILPF